MSIQPNPFLRPAPVENLEDLTARLERARRRVSSLDVQEKFLSSVVTEIENEGLFRPVRLPRIWKRMRTLVASDSVNHPLIDQAVTRAAEQAELYWVSTEMAQLAADAAADLPEVHLGADLWPSEYGFMVFDWPIPVTGFQLARPSWSRYRSTEQIRAILWGPGGDGVVMSMFADLAAVAAMVVREYGSNPSMTGDRLLRDMHDFHKNHGELMGLGVAHFPIDQPVNPDNAPYEPHIAVLMSTVWLLMQQPLMVEKSKRKMDGKTARKLQRAGERVPEVSLIELRRLQGKSTAGSSGRNYTHRWAVRGHWRRQWFPSVQMHRPTWVRPHVKGPDGGEFLTSERVNVWKR